MNKLLKRYWEFLLEFTRKDSDFAFGIIAMLLIFYGFTFFLFTSREGGVGLPVAVAFFFTLVVLLIIPALFFPLMVAAQHVQIEGARNRVVVECLEQIAELKDGMEFNRVYNLSKGYSIAKTDLNAVKGLLENALGPEFEVRIECHHEMSKYRVELVKHLELAPVVSS